MNDETKVKLKATALGVALTGLAIWAGESMSQYAAYPGYPWPDLPHCYSYGPSMQERYYCARLLPDGCCGTVLQAPTVTQLPERFFKNGVGVDCWWGIAKAEAEADADQEVQRYEEAYVRLDCDIMHEAKYATHKCRKGTDRPQDQGFSNIGHRYTIATTCEYIREDVLDKYTSKGAGTCQVGAYGIGPPIVCTD